MLSNLPLDLKKLDKEKSDYAVLRAAIMAELDAINLYEQLAAYTDSETLKEVLLDVAREEKTHAGEFQTMLLKLDKEQVEENKEAKEEIEELLEELKNK